MGYLELRGKGHIIFIFWRLNYVIALGILTRQSQIVWSKSVPQYLLCTESLLTVRACAGYQVFPITTCLLATGLSVHLKLISVIAIQASHRLLTR